MTSLDLQLGSAAPTPELARASSQNAQGEAATRIQKLARGRSGRLSLTTSKHGQHGQHERGNEHEHSEGCCRCAGRT